MTGKRDKFWNGEPPKKGGVVKAGVRKRGKQTWEGEHGKLAVYVSTPYRKEEK